MKKILLLLLSLTLAAGVLGACGFGVGTTSSSGTTDSNGSSIEASSQENSTVTQTYKVTFQQDGYEDVVKEVQKGGALAEEDIPQIKEVTGYTVAWEEVDLSNIQKDITVKAVATPKEYTITYDAGEGVATATTQKVTYDTAPGTLATATRVGYHFTGWTYEGKAVLATDAWKIAQDITLVASWQELVVQKCYVIFAQDGVEPISVEVVKGGSLTAENIPQTKEVTGYTVAWEEVDLTNIQDTVTVNAVITPIEYTITYDAGEGTVTPATKKITYNTIPGEFATPTREGYHFTGWTYEGKAVLATDAWKIAQDITLVASWVEVQKFAVTFAQTGFAPIVIEVEEGDSLKAEDIPQTQAVTGYNVAWEEVDLTNIQASITVKAITTPKEYTITYDAGDGTVTPKTQKVTYNTIPGEFAKPTREGYNFTGWTYNGYVVSPTTEWTIDDENAVLVAEWDKIINTYTVIFRQSGQEDKIYQGVVENTEFTEIPAPVAKQGYTVEWNSEQLALLANITQNVIVEATEKAKTYTVKLTLNGGVLEGEKTLTMTYGQAYTLPTPTHPNEDYRFIGWKRNKKTIPISGIWTIDEGDIELVATWREKGWTGNY